MAYTVNFTGAEVEALLEKAETDVTEEEMENYCCDFVCTSDLASYRTSSDQDTIDAGKMPNVAVTAADNGKFLTVVNGAWAATTMQTWQGGSY